MLSLTVGVFLSVLCDNLLLTVVVPILPDLLREDFAVATPVRNINGKDDACLRQLFHLQMVKEDSQLGFLLSTKALMQLVCNPMVGTVILRIGYKYPLLLGNCVLMLCALLFGFAKSYWLFIIGRTCHGLASSLISVAGMALIAELYQADEPRTKFLGRIMSGAALGVLIGYPFGGLGYSFTGKTVPFMMIAMLALFNTVIYITQFRSEATFEDHGEANALKWLQKWREHPDYRPKTTEKGRSLLMVPPSTIFTLLKDRTILIITIAVWFSTTTMSVLEPTLPIWLIEKIDPPNWQLGIVFVPDSLGYFLGTNFSGQFARRVGRWKVSMCSMSMIGVACLLLPFGNNILQLAIPHFMLGIGLGIVDASLMPLLARISDEKYHSGYSAVYALAQTSVALAYSFGPLLGGQLVGFIGFPGLIRSLGVINLLFCPFLFFIAKYENEMQQSEQYIPYQSLENYHTMKVSRHNQDSSRSLSNSTSHSSSILDNEEDTRNGKQKHAAKVVFEKEKSSRSKRKLKKSVVVAPVIGNNFEMKSSVNVHTQQPEHKSSKRFHDELDSD